MDQAQQQRQELPEEALGLQLQATIADARYIQKQDMSSLTLSVQYMGKSYRVRKNLWAGRGNTIRSHDGCLVAMCSADGLDYDTFARSVPERLDLAHRSYTLTVAVRRTDSGKLWTEIVSYSVREEGKERTREEILEDVAFRLNQKISELEISICTFADTQQKAESECRRLSNEYEALAAEYRSVVAERDELRRRLGMEPGRSVSPGNLIQLPGPYGNPPRRAYRRRGEEELVQGDEILQAYLDGKI